MMEHRPEFTQWWYYAKFQALRSRHIKLGAAESRKARPARFISWTSCVKRNKCKIENIYRGKRQPSEQKTNSQWDNCITWQRRKLIRLLDNIEMWRKLETRLLDRMNAHNFPRDKAPDLQWKKVVNRQICKIHQRLAKDFVRVRTHTDSFDQVIRQGKARLRKQYIEIFDLEDAPWTIAIKVNKLKINTMHIRSDWVQTICGNKYKLEKRDREPRIYRQGMFTL